eukprot:s335_g16.t1
MWEQASTGCKHLQSQRFLSPDFPGTIDDPSLRPAVEMLARGQKVYQLPPELRDPLWKWLSAFKLVRTVERSVEGAHSLVSRALKRAPAAKLPYLSVEIRFSLMKPMLRELALNPQARAVLQRLKHAPREKLKALLDQAGVEDNESDDDGEDNEGNDNEGKQQKDVRKACCQGNSVMLSLPRSLEFAGAGMSNTPASKLESQHQRAIPAGMVVDLEMDENLSHVCSDGGAVLVHGAEQPLALHDRAMHAAADAASAMPVSFHGLGANQLEQRLPGKRKCSGYSFFRLLEGRMSKHTIQGGPVSHDFLAQMYAAFSEEGADRVLDSSLETVSVAPAGLPLSWDTGELDLQVLVSGLSFWSLASSEYVCLDLPFLPPPQIQQIDRSNDAKDLLLAMLKSGAVQGSVGSKSFFYVPASQRRNDPMTELLNCRFVQAVHDTDSSFQILPRGLSGLVLMQTATCCGGVSTYKRTSPSVPVSDMKDQDAIATLETLTRWELQLLLVEEGWEDVYSRKRKLPPITADTFKGVETEIKPTYFYDHTLGKGYLMCLVLISRLLGKGLRELHHFQLQSYYSALIDSLQSNPGILDQVLPNQPLAFYKEQKTRNQSAAQQRRGLKRKANHESFSHLPAGFEAEQSLSAPPTAQPQTAKRLTGKGRAGRGPGRSQGSGGRGRNRDEPDDMGNGQEPYDPLPQAVCGGAKEEPDEIQLSGSGSGVVVVPGSDSEPEPSVLVSHRASKNVLVPGQASQNPSASGPLRPPATKSTGSRDAVEHSHQDCFHALCWLAF